MIYDFKNIDKKWQNKWYSEGTFFAKDDPSMKKWYGLVEFPYPSGQGLHVGHPRSYTALDIMGRKKRMEGYNVLYPIGFDAFGLPAENYAIKNHVHPKITTEKNVNHFREQLKSLGFSFDWSREVNTTDPNYYKWTQWIFIQLFKKGLAYKTTMPINYCTGCKVGLANEEVVNGVCERCGSAVVQKEKSQWMLKITNYAQRLIDDLDEVNFLDKIKAQQINWIGRSEGAEVKFKIANSDEELTVYTTRPDTLFGATYMVVAPEHEFINKLKDRITNLEEVEEYKRLASLKSDFERSELNKEKSGVEIKGIKAINPLTGREIPIWASDYVLITYGTGAIMAVPAHDSRDWEFAKKFNLPIIEVVSGGEDVQKSAFTDVSSGTLVNSGFLNGLNVKDAMETVIGYLEENGIGKRKVNYKLRDWVFSRQRYWGEPIPMVYCEKCGWVPIPEEELPLVLPEGIEPIRINWTDISDNDKLKPETEINDIINSYLFDPSTSNYKGVVGQKQTFILTVIKAIPVDTRFGSSTIHTMVDKDDNEFVWTTGSKTLVVGNKYKVTGTIKEHKKYRNVKQTILTRCTVENLEG